MKYLFTLVAAMATSHALLAQKVSISKVELTGNKVVVTYELEDSNPNNEYLISLYGSKDNFAGPLTKVSGDVGSGIKAGLTKKIEWRITEEYGSYKGKLSLEIKGRVFIPVVRLEGSGMKSSYKRGKSYQVVWHSGDPSGQVNVELYKGDERISGERNLANNGNYTWHVPPKTKTGKDYHMRFSNPKNPEEVVISKPFKIAPKIPLVVKILPVVAVGGALIFLGGGEGGGGSEGGIPNPPLPTN
ncbi:MAG TPA: Ser-Thr-rich GPI-anchored membrane family protein [Cyclobacteriaceae bacterium]|nr:Ser-Thr-rich GPI-anchored membrane family protein [Cyclobacteriaceae bacterium]